MSCLSLLVSQPPSTPPLRGRSETGGWRETSRDTTRDTRPARFAHFVSLSRGPSVPSGREPGRASGVSLSVRHLLARVSLRHVVRHAAHPPQPTGFALPSFTPGRVNGPRVVYTSPHPGFRHSVHTALPSASPGTGPRATRLIIPSPGSVFLRPVSRLLASLVTRFVPHSRYSLCSSYRRAVPSLGLRPSLPRLIPPHPHPLPPFTGLRPTRRV